jgi:hypothetical protein
MFISYRKYEIVRVALAAALIAGIFHVRPAKAETVDFGWVQGGGGTNLDYGTAIALDNGGNVYATGFVNNGPGNEDGFLQKWDASGNHIWSKFVAGPAHDTDHDVALDGEGNVYVAGAYSNTVEFDPGNSAADLTSEGLTDIFVIKYDADGNFIWVKSVGGISSDGGYGITADESGNVYVTGIYVNTVDFDPGVGISTLTSAGFADVFVLKLDSEGNFLWAKSMGGPGSDYSFDVAVDGNGNIFTTGYFNDTADFDPGTGTSNLTSQGQGDLFISKLDSSGDFVWAQRMGGSSFDAGIEIAVDGLGNMYTVGYLDVGRSHDVFLGKLDGNGNLLWAHVVGGESYDTGYGIALDASGNVYYTGDFSGTVDFDPGAGTSSLTSTGASDIFISKLDSDGNFVWAKNLGGTSADSGDGIVVHDSGSLYIVGTFSDTVDFDPGAGTSTLTSAGSLDVFIARLNLTPQVHYVKWNATGANDGSSWADAYTDLQSALAAASNGDEIWVAAGTYKPTPTIDRSISFVLKNGVAVYGGFAGTETAHTQRDYETNLTILSGDIGVQDDNSDNSYHVLVGSNTNNSATLDGFTVTAGNAFGLVSPDLNGGGINNHGNITIVNSTITQNQAVQGGGVYNTGFLTIANSSFTDNTALDDGGAIGSSGDNPSIRITESDFTSNHAERDGGAVSVQDGNLIVQASTFANNTADSFGGSISIEQGGSHIFQDNTFLNNSAQSGGALRLESVEQPVFIRENLFSNNHADYHGGAIFEVFASSLASFRIENNTFHANHATDAGAVSVNDQASIINNTFSDNSAVAMGASLYMGQSADVVVWNNIFANGIGTQECYFHNSGFNSLSGGHNLVEDGSPTCLPTLTGDPMLDSLADNGGSTETMALGAGSPAIDSGDDTNCPATDQRGVTRPQGSHCDVGAYEYDGLESVVKVVLGTSEVDSYVLAPQESIRDSYAGINNGPVKIVNTHGVSITAAERVIYKVNGVNTSLSEMMGLPASQLDNTYWLPWYNNVDLDTQLRFANVTDQPATVTVTIGGVPQTPINLAGGESTRKSFPGINAGPVKIESTQNIVAAERVIYNINNIPTSFSEMMALPEKQLDTTYWLPWYNNVDLDTQLRIANVSNLDATITVTIGGVPQTPFPLAAGQSTRISYPTVNAGPVKIESTQNIVAAERVIYKINNIPTSFSEMMALPANQLNKTYWLPWYNNVDLDTQLRIANVSNTDATVTVTIGSVQQTPFALAAGQSTRISYPSVNSGPVKIESTQNIVVAERVIYKINNIPTSFSEMMALPNGLLDFTYWFPWYNNVDLDTQLRFGIP